MRILGWVVIALVAGCSGESSRVESTKVIDIKPIPDFGTLHLDELTASQWADACDWMVSVQGGSRTVDCVDGMMVTVESSQTCANEMLRPHCLASSLTDCIRPAAIGFVVRNPLNVLDIMNVLVPENPW